MNSHKIIALGAIAMTLLATTPSTLADPATPALMLPVSPASAPIRTIRVVAQGQPDLYSVDTIIASIIKPGMSQAEKAMAVYDFVRSHIYHYGPSREFPEMKNFEYGNVYDAVKLLNVYGYGYCYQNRSAAEALWKAAGLEARSAGIGGHAVIEVFFDGQYHYMDADQHGYCLLPDGKTIASIEQIERDPFGLLINQPNPSTPYFPITADPKAPYEAKDILASYFASTKNNHYQHDKTVRIHRMDLTLLPGMRLTRNFTHDGRWNYHSVDHGGEFINGYHDPAIGPKDFLSETTYANGELLYQPNLTDASDEYAAGVWADSNVAPSPTGLAPATPVSMDKPAWAVFRIALPYVIVGWPSSFRETAPMQGAAVVSATFHGQGEGQGLDVSIDNGATWTPVWEKTTAGAEQAIADLSAQVGYRYHYLLRVRLANARTQGARLESLSIRTAFQVAPRSLPAVKAGHNSMRVQLDDGAEVIEFFPNLNKPEAFLAALHSSRDIRVKNGEIRSIDKKRGELVFEMTPPQPGDTIAGLAIHAGLRREPARLNYKDDIKILYAVDTPDNWTLLYDDDYPPAASHWSYHANAEAVCPDGTRRVFLKFEVETASDAAIRFLQLRLRVKPQGIANSLGRGVLVTHKWKEGDQQRVFGTTINSAPAIYSFEAGANPENQAIVMEPVRHPRTPWREDDPVVERTVEPDTNLVDAELRDTLRDFLRTVNKDTKEVPPLVAEKMKWVVGVFKELRQMYDGNYPVKPRVTANPFADAEKAANAARTLTGTDGYAKIRVLSALRRANPTELPDAVLGALKDPWKHVRLEALLAIRAAKDAKASEALRAMAKEDPEAFLRAEAQSVLDSF